MSKSLEKGRDGTLERLEGLNGAQFDKAYVEVTYHPTVLDALDKPRIPRAKNEELKASLVKARPPFVAHLEHANHIQGSFQK
jgi:putative membrane protein